MTRIETSRVREVLGVNITAVKEAAEKLTAECELQELEADVDALEKSLAVLKGSLAGLPFKHSE